MSFGNLAVADRADSRIWSRDVILGRTLSRKHRMLIGADWVDAASGERIEVFDPATGNLIARAPAGGSSDVDRAVTVARASFAAGLWAGISGRERGRILSRVADLIERNSAELASIEILNNGTPLNLQLATVAFAASVFRYFSGWCDKISGSTFDLSEGDAQFNVQVTKEPIGVVGLIVPWNGPLGAASLKLAPALAAGCSCVLKPSEETPLSALRLGELLLEAGLPAGVVNIVTGYGHVAGAAVAAHPDVDKVSFTGSTEVGKLLVAAAAGNLKKLSLELGGKSPVIVFADADLQAAAAGVAMGTFINTGQVCVAGSRVYVARPIIAEFVAAMAEFARALPIGSGFDPSAVIGPLISEKQRQRVHGFVDGAVAEQAVTVIGGSAKTGAGYFYPPTILTAVRPGSKILREEIFGPVITVIPFDEDDAVIASANDTRFGLAAAIWTQNLGKAQRTSKQLKAGTVWVNCQMVLAPQVPFGGYRQSGWARENGLEGLHEYMQTKSTIVRF